MQRYVASAARLGALLRGRASRSPSTDARLEAALARITTARGDRYERADAFLALLGDLAVQGKLSPARYDFWRGRFARVVGT